MRRRAILVAAAVVAGGGCLSKDGSLEPGTLVVDNDQDDSRTVTVTAERYADRPDSSSSGPATPVGTPTERRETTVRVPAGDRLTRQAFIAAPGAYHVVARTASGLRDRAWASFGEASGSGVTGGFVSVDCQENGRLTVGSPTVGA